MDMTVQQVQGKVPVTVLQTHGDLDASNYKNLIAKAICRRPWTGRYGICCPAGLDIRE